MEALEGGLIEAHKQQLEERLKAIARPFGVRFLEAFVGYFFSYFLLKSQIQDLE
jgi:hypothetical protein